MEIVRQLNRASLFVFLLASGRDLAAGEKTVQPAAPVRFSAKAVENAGPASAGATLFMMTRSKPATCDVSAPPPAVSLFAVTDPQAFLWFYATNVAAGDVFASEYYTPSGAFYAAPSGPWEAAKTAGNKCYADSAFQIAGTLPATQPGPWTVRVRVNGALLFTHTFTIAAASACTYTLNSTSQSLDAAGGTIQVGVVAAASCIWTASSNAAFLSIQSGASGSGSGTVAVSVTANNTSSSRTGTITIAGQTYAVNQTGTAPAQVLLSMMTRAKPPTCDLNAPPAAATSLASTDPQAFLWFYAANVAVGDVFASEYYTPAGAFYAATSGAWDAAATAGNKCYADGVFQIAGAVPATLPGIWSVRVKLNGNQLFTLPFTITGVVCMFGLNATSQSIAAAGGSLSVSVTAGSGCVWSASSNASWITVTPVVGNSGNGTVSLSIAVNASNSPRSGTVTIAGQAYTVNQSGKAAQVLSSMMTRVRPSACDLKAPPAVTAPLTTADQQAFLWLYVSSVAAGDIFASEYYTPSGTLYSGAGGAWNASPSGGDKCLTDTAFQISGAAPAKLPGDWSVRIKLNGNPLFTLTFTIAALASAAPAITSFGGGASFSSAAEDGSWATIAGTNLAAATRTWRADEIAGGNLPVSLDGVSVTVDGKAACIYFISPNQINFQVPDTGVTGPVQVVVRNAGGTSNSFTGLIGKYAPGLFIFPLKDGRAYPAAVAADGSFLGPAGLFNNAPPTRGARPGETILLYGTGFGPTVQQAPAGKVVSGAIATADPVTAIIGGSVVTASYAGLTGVGLYQINVTVPAGLMDGAYSLTLSVAGAQTQPGVYLNVAR